MSSAEHFEPPSSNTEVPTPDASRVEPLFQRRYDTVTRRTDRLFAWLMIGQWVAAVLVSYWLSPYAWAGKTQVLHGHVWAALFIGGAISSLPTYLAFTQPGKQSTRYVIAVAQVLWSALLIHLTGGRIETHFHVFGSLAILAFYRDLKVLVPATVIVAADHFIRGVYWPESVYGVANPEWWRFIEHAGWVVFIDVFLIMNCSQAYKELWDLSRQHVELEDSADAIRRMEKLAAVGQLAASIGHELRNPLAAVRNAQTYIAKRLGQTEQADPKVTQFLGIMGRELDASAKIISDLLDFSRPREPVLAPCPLRPLVDETLSVVRKRDNVTVVNDVPETLPVPDVDKDQIRQVLINLVQNAIEAIPSDRRGTITVGAVGGGANPWRISVQDDGIGVPHDVGAKIFEPLFSSKAKGTGLGLAVASHLLSRHGGKISMESEEGRGTTFTIELPAPATAGAA